MYAKFQVKHGCADNAAGKACIAGRSLHGQRRGGKEGKCEGQFLDNDDAPLRKRYRLLKSCREAYGFLADSY